MNSRPLLGRPVRVGLLTPYFSFFEGRFPETFRARQEEYASDLANRIAASGAEVTAAGLIDSSESAVEARERLREAAAEVIVIAPLMASPPQFVLDALKGIDAPLLIWNDRRVDELQDELDEVEATRVSSLIGSTMVANALERSNLRFAVFTTKGNDDQSIGRAIRAAAVAPRLRTLRLGLLGDPVDGYADVVLDDAAADALGVTLVRVPVESFIRIHGDVNEHARAQSEEQFRLAGVRVAGASAGELRASLAVHSAFQLVVAAYEVDALAINCHSDALRWAPEIGIVGCLGATLLTSAGWPVSCTGDSATAIGLAVATILTGHAQYCEGYVLAGRTGELLLSSCGMADLALKAPGDPGTVAPNDLYPGNRGLGCLCRHGFPAGRATIIGFAGDSPRLVWASGDLTGRAFERLNGPSGSFIFAGTDSNSVVQRWIESAPAHHIALAEGWLDVEFEIAARFLDFRFINV